MEFNSLDLAVVSKVWCIVIQDVATEEIWRYGPDQIPQALEKLNTFDRIIGHNIITADLPVLAKLYNFNPTAQVIDTLVLSRLSNPDRIMPWGMSGPWHPHAIAAWGWRLGRAKVEWDKWDEWDEGMLNRCEQDVLINLAVYKALWQEFRE